MLDPYISMEETRKGIGRKKVDLAILDYNIAGEPVLPLVETLTAKNVPVIIVTGYGSNLIIPDTLERVTIVHKPVAVDLLRKLAAKHIEADKD